MSRPNATLRLRQYAPLGAPLGIVPDMGVTLVSGPDGGTLQATFSTAVAYALPDDCEVAVEIFDDVSAQWVEGPDSRFVLLTQDSDDRDATGMVTLTGLSLPVWLAQKAALASQVPYSDSGNVEPAMVGTGISVSGHTFTWAGHSLTVGDRVRITNAGKSKGLSKGAVYFVRSFSGSTFTLSHTATGATKSFGSSHSIGMERVRTRISNLNGHQFAKNMAVSVWDATANQALTNGSKYYVVNPLAASIQLASKPGGMPIELIADALTVYRYIDGQRVWKNATAGNVISTAFTEARNRGWGQDAQGADQVFHSWTVEADSNSLVWPARVDDPTITGVSVGFQPGTSLWSMIQFLTTNGWAEFASHGRTFDLFAPLTGNDYSTGRSPKLIGTTANSVRILKDLTDYRTTEIVRGEGPVEVIVKGARSPWGVLELYTTASGVGTASHAKSYGQADVTQYSKPQVGYTVTAPASAGELLPIFDYQRGDWVQVLVKGTPTRLRVTQWTLTKAADGTLSVSTLLEAKKRNVLHKIASAAKKANGGRATTTTSTTPAEIDKRKAAQPATLTVSARSSSAADRSAAGSITVAWLPVTADTDGDDLAAEHYEVVVRADGEQEGKVVATTKGTTVDLPAMPAGQSIAVAVRAISSTGEAGELTDEVEYVVDLPADVPDAPSAPTVTSTLGSIVVAWDGNLVDPIDGPHLPETADALSFVQVQRSTDGTTWTTEAQTLAAAGAVTDLGLTVGSSYQYRLVAVSQLGVSSAPSPTATGTVVAVDTAQIDADFTAQVTKAASDASAAQTAAAQAAQTASSASSTAQQAQTAATSASTAASNAQTAATAASTAAAAAQTSANGKNAITTSTAAASGSGVTAGDLWQQVDASSNVIAAWRWTVTNGSGSWVQQYVGSAYIAALDAGKITTGYLAAARIQAGSITSDKIVANSIGASQIASASITGDRLVANTITASQIAAATITSAQIAAATITAGNIAANTITAGQLAANTITAAQLSATAIDAMTITGATFRTASTATTAGGVQLDSTGLHGYNAAGVATFSLDTAGNLSVSGKITGGSITGSVDISTGTITGTGTVSQLTLSGGAATFAATDGSGGATHLDAIRFYFGDPNYSALMMQWDTTTKANASIISRGRLLIEGGSGDGTVQTGGDLALGYDGAAYVGSSAIRNRTVSGAAANVTVGGATAGLVTIDSSGKLGILQGYLQDPDAYSRVVTTRAAYVTNLGTFGTTSSSRRTKNLHRHIKMDDRAMEAWLGLPTWEFEYKPEIAPESPGLHHGLVAEEVSEAGFDRLVYRDENEGPNKGRIDGFAYEKMGVYNRMAIKRLFERLVTAEEKLARLEARS